MLWMEDFPNNTLTYGYAIMGCQYLKNILIPLVFLSWAFG